MHNATAERLRLLEREPANAQACCVIGHAALSQSDYQKAGIWFTRASSFAPECAEAHFGLGIVHRRLSRTREALACFEQAIRLKADDAEALVEQAEVLNELGELEDAEDSFSLALAFEPDLYRANLGYGKFLRASGQLEKALVYLRRSAELSTASREAWFELGLTLNAAADTTAARAAYEKAIELAPDQPTAYVNLGLIYLAQLGDPARAEQLFRMATQLAPDMVESQVNLGLALHEQGRCVEALEHYDRLVEADPGCVECRWHRATVRLALGNYESGWDDYEARKLRGERWWRQPPPFPEWDGTALRNDALLIYPEQGVGDELMFASCLPDVLSVAPGCVVECDVRLAGLFQRSFPRAAVHGTKRNGHRAWLANHPELRVQCAIGSLPRLFRRSRDSFAARPAFLHADTAKVDRWRKALKSRDHAINVGISWRGGTPKTRKELRSTSLGDWAPILRSKGFRFFALQPPLSEELGELAPIHNLELHELADTRDDLDELAAVISALDLVISVQGTVVHLAGALGRPVWVLLGHSCEWRYLQTGERMPWYPSARLFRQPARNEWQPVFQQVSEALSAFCAR